MQYYVYEWFNKTTGEIFYVGKGCYSRHKQVKGRNKLFMQYYNNNDCDNRIIKYFETEKEAFEYEHIRIKELKKKAECLCNLDYGGKGGYHFIWTPELRKYKSIYNPMKNQYQKDRMRKNNPMKNPVNVEKIRQQKSKKVVLGDVVYNSLRELAQAYGVHDNAVQYWLQRGYGKNNQACYYFGTTPKEIVIRTHETSNKPVKIDGIIFKNVKTGAKYIGVWPESLIKALKSNKKCRGHICEYVNQQPSHTNSDKSSMKGSTTNE